MPKTPPKKPKETAEEHRKHIAQEAEEACHLDGNINGPDLDEGGFTDGRKINSDLA